MTRRPPDAHRGGQRLHERAVSVAKAVAYDCPDCGAERARPDAACTNCPDLRPRPPTGVPAHH